jgi:FMN phosphatase YigB (HAD superfamily)
MNGLAVFCDIGDTLASAVVEGGHLSRLETYRFVPEVLTAMRAAGGEVPVSLGLISNTGDQTADSMRHLLTEAGLLPLVDAGLCLFSSVEGLDKTQPAFFTRACERAGLPPARCIFVGESADERGVAASAGLQVSPHPLHGLHLASRMLAAHPQP